MLVIFALDSLNRLSWKSSKFFKGDFIKANLFMIAEQDNNTDKMAIYILHNILIN